jgi:UDP-N-acetylglucosamine 1-carboxyvinyltransferase
MRSCEPFMEHEREVAVPRAPLPVDAERREYRVQRSVLSGHVEISGAKNSALKLLTASLLTSENVVLHNFPHDLLDARVHLAMLEVLGKTWERVGGSLVITETDARPTALNWEGRSIRNTLLILGALTARRGEGRVPSPGGCDLGDRKYDLHELVLRTLGADVTDDGTTLSATAVGSRLVGADVVLPLRSTGATENAVLCGVLATGTTRIWNPHVRPEILDLISMLRGMGARIRVFGQEHIEIEGVDRLRGVEHHVVPDNMEALTWLVGAVVTGGDVEIAGFPTAHLEVPLIHLKESGARFFAGPESLIVRGGRPLPIEIATGAYPGINSDMQPLFAAFATFARGRSKIVDLRFPGRYQYASELTCLGARLQTEDNVLTIDGSGGTDINGAEVRATDLRAGIALTIVGWGAPSGLTVIRDAWQIERGYDRFVEKAKSLGAWIEAR